jgi:hypothetical protein
VSRECGQAEAGGETGKPVHVLAAEDVIRGNAFVKGEETSE